MGMIPDVVRKLKPGQYDLESHASRVARFRHKMTMAVKLRKPDLFTLYLTEVCGTFSRREIEWLVEAFNSFAPAEIVAGKAISGFQRNKMLIDLGSRASGDPGQMKYFLTPGEIQFAKGMWQKAKEPPRPQVGKPTPIAVVFGHPVYRTESPRDQVIRQLGEGEYLFGDLGGLTGGLAFVISRDVMGNSHDQAVKHGAFFSTFGQALGALSDGIDHAGQMHDARPDLGGPTPLQPRTLRGSAPRRGSVLQVIPALPSPKNMGTNAHKSMIELLRTLNSGG